MHVLLKKDTVKKHSVSDVISSYQHKHEGEEWEDGNPNDMDL